MDLFEGILRKGLNNLRETKSEGEGFIRSFTGFGEVFDTTEKNIVNRDNAIAILKTNKVRWDDISNEGILDLFYQGNKHVATWNSQTKELFFGNSGFLNKFPEEQEGEEKREQFEMGEAKKQLENRLNEKINFYDEIEVEVLINAYISYLGEPAVGSISFDSENDAWVAKHIDGTTSSFTKEMLQKIDSEIMESKQLLNEDENDEEQREDIPSENSKTPEETPSIDSKETSEEIPNTTKKETKVLEQEPLGQKGQNEYFLLKRIYTDDGNIKDLLVITADEKQVLSASELGFSPEDVATFILKANEKINLTLINIEIVKNYFMHEKEVVEEVPNEEPEEKTILKSDAAIPAPEELPKEVNPGNLAV